MIFFVAALTHLPQLEGHLVVGSDQLAFATVTMLTKQVQVHASLGVCILFLSRVHAHLILTN